MRSGFARKGGNGRQKVSFQPNFNKHELNVQIAMLLFACSWMQFPMLDHTNAARKGTHV